MRFIVTSAGKKANSGNIFFSIPTASAMEEAINTVSALCRRKVVELYGGKNSPYYLRLETELAKMRKTDTAYHFLVLKEIAEVSQNEGYPIMLEDNAAGSLIAFLLDITTINPLLPYDPCLTKGVTYDNNGSRSLPNELVFGTFQNPKIPIFSFEIAAAVYPLIQHRLDSTFGTVKSDHKLFRQITWVSSTQCAIIGDMAKIVGAPTDEDIYQQNVYLHALKDIACIRGYPFTKEVCTITSCDFYTLTKIYGRLQGTFPNRRPRTLQDDIDDPHFFTTRDELFHTLRACGMSAEDALDTIEHGVWSYGERREKYRVLLENCYAPKWLDDYFEHVFNLWSAAACISRLQQICRVAWYQLHYPEEFANCLEKHKRC